MNHPSRKRQKGFTLVELLVVVAVVGTISVMISAVIMQTFSQNTRVSDDISVTQEVSDAGFWIKQDAVKAQVVEVNSPDLISLSWVDWSNSTHAVVYSLSGGQLIRTYAKDGISLSSRVVADSIIEANSSSTWVGNMLTVQLEAGVGEQKAVQTYQIKPRPVF